MNTQQDSRKILEDLNFKKQQLQKGLPIPQTQYEPQFNQAARATFQQAQSTSSGFFILTDSNFATIKLKKLEEYLQCVDSFENPKILLEQYITPSHISSHFLYTIQNNYDDIRGKLVADLGSGTGMLSIGSAILEASHVIGFEIDSEALQIARFNADEMEVQNIDFLQCDVLTDFIDSRFHKAFDTVILNPPFGTKKNAGIDIEFLKTAILLSNTSIYSLHKTSTRNYIQKKSKEFNCKGEVIAELRYNLDSSYKFHKKASKDIEVDVWRFSVIK
ncbi:hypothetical protein PVAND_013887 [Polypedilum vanderplanki]|uniref:Methyltransferase-like protein 5 n=1 Tax=Polypedilum vanderplanki TaxID=319348 RepID=A0A9J6CRL0_POLVA|nr:hypothetical protein PVAND_013887 [Polypedilum vanderplanki]